MIGRRMIAAGVVAGAVAVGGVAGAMIGIPGLSGATISDSSTSTSTPSGEMPYGPGPHHRFFGDHGFNGARMGDDGVLAAAAQALNLSTEELMQKLSDGKTTIADVADQQNVDVQTVIDAMEAVAKQHIEDLVNNPLPAPPDFRGGPMFGHGHFGFGIGGPGMRDLLDPVAQALGITSDELQNDLRDGQSIADIAKTNNVDLGTVVDAVVKDAQSKLDQAVKDGNLTQDQADHLAANLKERVTDLLNHQPLPGRGPWGGFHMHGGPGPDGFDHPGPGGPQMPNEASPSAAT